MKTKNYIKLFLITILILISGCSLKRKNSFSIDKKAVISQEFYIDSSFNSSQAESIRDAMNEWNTATRGMVKFSIVQSIKITSKDPNYDFGKNVIIKTDSNDPFVKEQNNKLYGHGGEVIGLQLPTLDGKYSIIYIVSDQVANMVQYRLNVTHELGHSISMIHISDAPAIMDSPFNKNLRCLTLRDMKQFCDFYTCNPEEMNYCEDYSILNQMFH